MSKKKQQISGYFKLCNLGVLARKKKVFNLWAFCLIRGVNVIGALLNTTRVVMDINVRCWALFLFFFLKAVFIFFFFCYFFKTVELMHDVCNSTNLLFVRSGIPLKKKKTNLQATYYVNLKQEL